MATDDLQVLVTGNATAPATFTVPGNGQIRPKAVFAIFDGTGAGGDFQAALKVTSDGGELVGVYPCATTVTAGASVDVSWFPHVAAQAVATGTGLPWCYGTNSNVSVPGDGSWTTAQMTGANFAGGTSDSSVMSFAANGSGDYGISLNAEGIYLFMARFTPNPITDRTLAYSAQVRLVTAETDLWDQNLVPFVPDLGGTLAHAYPSITGLYNIGPDSTPAPVVVVAQGAQDSGGALTSAAGLFAYRLNPADSGDF